MKALPLALALTASAVAIPLAAHAERIAYYRLGAAAIGPGSLEDPGSYSLGYGLNAGVSVPFMHRLAITLDLNDDRLAWESGSEPTVTTVRLERDDLSIRSAFLGLDVAYRRGHAARPLFSAGFGVARVRPGDAELTDRNSATRTTLDPGSETVFATFVAAGARVRLPGYHSALRLQLGWMGLAREEFSHLIPLRLQFEF